MEVGASSQNLCREASTVEWSKKDTDPPSASATYHRLAATIHRRAQGLYLAILCRWLLMRTIASSTAGTSTPLLAIFRLSRIFLIASLTA